MAEKKKLIKPYNPFDWICCKCGKHNCLYRANGKSYCEKHWIEFLGLKLKAKRTKNKLLKTLDFSL